MRITRVIGIVALTGALGCSGEMVPAPAKLSGNWSFNFNTASESGAACTGSMVFAIAQSDQEFTGTQVGPGTLVCSGVKLTAALKSTNAANPAEFDNETISTGVASPDEIAFTLARLNSTNTGTVLSATEMSGKSSWTLPVSPSGTVTVEGTWTAVKQ
jgi:hypothetical protein